MSLEKWILLLKTNSKYTDIDYRKYVTKFNGIMSKYLLLIASKYILLLAKCQAIITVSEGVLVNSQTKKEDRSTGMYFLN